MTKRELNVKNELKQYRYIKQELRQIREISSALRAKIEAPQGVKLTGLPKANNAKDIIPEMTDKLIALEKKYKNKARALLRAQSRIEAYIELLDPVQRVIIRERYISCRTWHRIPRDMNYSVEHIHRLHRIAIGVLASPHTKKDDTLCHSFCDIIVS